MTVDERPTSVRITTGAASAASGAASVTRNAAGALVAAVGALVESAVERVLLSDERVTSAAEAKRLLAGEADTEELADKIQRVVVLAVPVARMVAGAARVTRLPWVMIASSSFSIAAAVRAGVHELQLLASLVAHRLEEATGGPSDPALVTRVAIELYLHPKRTPDVDDGKLRLVRLTRKWLVGGALGRNTSKRATKALDAAEPPDPQALAAPRPGAIPPATARDQGAA